MPRISIPTRARSSASRRFDWDEVRHFWEQHQSLRAQTDLEEDPAGLGNVCTIGAPRWLNEHYARGQTTVFERLLARVPPPPGPALDVGCGAARWTQRLSERGWAATGIDLQESLIAHNRRQLPHIRFERVALQDFESDVPFSLIASVTVLGHNPHPDQQRAVEKLHSLTAPGSRLLLLENIREQGPHIFANSISGWIDKFQSGGFRCDAVMPYDFNPCLRGLATVRRTTSRLVKRSRQREAVAPDEYLTGTQRTGSSSVARGTERLYDTLLALTGAIDVRLDPWLTDRAAALPPPVHAGMLFVRT